MPADEVDDFFNEVTRLGYQKRNFLILAKERFPEVPGPIEREVYVARMHNGSKAGILFVGADAMRWPVCALTALKAGKLGSI